MISYSINVFGMAETNSGWQHNHLQQKLTQCLRRQFHIGKAVFGAPNHQIDPLEERETFQAGGSVQLVGGNLTTTVFGPPILDPSGLGRWCGCTFIGKAEQKLSVITGYRTCKGSIATSPLGSTFHREYEYHRQKGISRPQPRTIFLDDLSSIIRDLQDKGHAILIMMDANSVLETDDRLRDFLSTLALTDLQALQPASSTYIGSNDRRIDYMFGCHRTMSACCRQGTLSYFEGPQSDHRALYVDINLNILLGIAPIESIKPTNQRR